MGKGKTLKSVAARLKLTKHRKVLRRHSQLSHFKAKDSGQTRQKKRKSIRADKNPFIRKALGRYLHSPEHVRSRI